MRKRSLAPFHCAGITNKRKVQRLEHQTVNGWESWFYSIMDWIYLTLLPMMLDMYGNEFLSDLKCAFKPKLKEDQSLVISCSEEQGSRNQHNILEVVVVEYK